jgi:hypothetical protein
VSNVWLYPTERQIDSVRSKLLERGTHGRLTRFRFVTFSVILVITTPAIEIAEELEAALEQFAAIAEDLKC